MGRLRRRVFAATASGRSSIRIRRRSVAWPSTSFRRFRNCVAYASHTRSAARSIRAQDSARSGAQTYGGRLAYALGYTGLGVGASRFGAQVMLDLLDTRDTERTRLEMVRSKPMPFPPEPFRLWAINFTRRSFDQADRQAGQRNLWLRTLDRLGLGFDS